MYKQVTREGILFPTVKGNLSINQLWKTDFNTLITAEETYEELVDTLKKGSKRRSSIKTDDLKMAELRLSIVSDILDTREQERDAAKKAVDIKAEEQRLGALIREKEHEAEKDLSVDELKKRMADLKA